MERIGIIGGLGPAASARLYERITDFTDAATDQEHLDLVILSRPQIPDRTAYLLGVPGAESFVPPMREAARQLEDLGCGILATPCNTAHACLDEIAEGLQRARFISMVNETALRIAERDFKRVAVLATSGTRAARVYEPALEAVGCTTEWPDDQGQETVMAVIFDQVKAGKPVDFEAFSAVCARLRERGCDAAILACTELSVIGAPDELCGLAMVDALDVLAQACVCAAGAKLKRGN